MLYPDEWEDSDDTANRDKVLKALQRHTEIILPETFDQLNLKAELQANYTTGQKTKNTRLTDKLTVEQAAKWKEACDQIWDDGVNAWDKAIATLPLFKGNVIIRSKDKRIVCVKLSGGMDVPWKQPRQGRMTSKSLLAVYPLCTTDRAPTHRGRTLYRLVLRASRRLARSSSDPWRV
jgi:hypothetical protein